MVLGRLNYISQDPQRDFGRRVEGRSSYFVAHTHCY